MPKINYFVDSATSSIPLSLVPEDQAQAWLVAQGAAAQTWAKAQGWTGQLGKALDSVSWTGND